MQRIAPIVAALLAASLLAACSDSAEPPKKSAAAEATKSNTEIRFDDLAALKAALDKYRTAKGRYPVSQGFAGFPSKWGTSAEVYIKELTPDFIAKLPLDPGHARPENPSQYLYKSDGKDYKLLAHNTEDCEQVKKSDPALIDPKRVCWGYGYWTTGAANW